MVPRLSILPIWVCAALAMISGNGLAFVLTVGLILAYAAAITSLGLALATWIPRLGRVVTTSVIAYVLVTVGWPILLSGVSSYRYTNPDTWHALNSASPFFGINAMTGLSARLGFTNGYGSGGISDLGAEVSYFWAAVWIVAYAAIAGVLALAVRLSFDRCVGRATGKAQRDQF
jgi:hypothetical protein